jgi:hypothetical protein
MANWFVPPPGEDEQWAPNLSRWILDTGYWRDDGIWIDDPAVWRDFPKSAYVPPPDTDESWDQVAGPGDNWFDLNDPGQSWSDA